SSHLPTGTPGTDRKRSPIPRRAILYNRAPTMIKLGGSCEIGEPGSSSPPAGLPAPPVLPFPQSLTRLNWRTLLLALLAASPALAQEPIKFGRTPDISPDGRTVV